MSVVVDASLVVALLVPDERQDAARDHLRRWLDGAAALHAPAVLSYEVANVLARLVFDCALGLDEVRDIWDDLAALGIVLHPFELTRDGPEVAEIAARLRHRDATSSSYFCLARRLGTTVWTLDAALARNASDMGLPVQHVS
ncbi:MAG: type II toxin-antitoxin system VapC family toxin [Geodermatophilaceae bacterium]|nr:type II toxin-antitoxin system VapC family toxin [Geodermatophilaceae bacterium]